MREFAYTDYTTITIPLPMVTGEMSVRHSGGRISKRVKEKDDIRNRFDYFYSSPQPTKQ